MRLKIVAALLLALGTAWPAAAQTFVAPTPGRIVAYFGGGAASFQIRLGLFVEGVQQGGLALSNQTSPYGASFDFGPVAAGQDYYFGIDINNGSYQLFTDPALNGGNAQSDFAVYPGDPTIPPGFRIGFDDTPGGNGYGDYVFVYDLQPLAATPEPTVWALLIGGFGAAGAMLRRRRRGQAAGAGFCAPGSSGSGRYLRQCQQYANA